jgi:hypothetical protein
MQPTSRLSLTVSSHTTQRLEPRAKPAMTKKRALTKMHAHPHTAVPEEREGPKPPLT